MKRRHSSRRSLNTNVPRTKLKRRSKLRPLELPLKRRRNFKDSLPFKKKLTTVKLRSMKQKPSVQEKRPISSPVLAQLLRR